MWTLAPSESTDKKTNKVWNGSGKWQSEILGRENFFTN